MKLKELKEQLASIDLSRDDSDVYITYTQNLPSGIWFSANNPVHRVITHGDGATISLE